jgi:diguanylate cyclase (GGDEF)-like protein
MINDTYGHEKGDVYLQTIARVIEVIGTKEQITVRHGGDEFVLFLYGYENQEELFLDIEKLQQIRQHASAQLNEELSVPICFSFGYCLCDNKTEYRNMLAEADQAMYEDKRRRKN